MTPRPFDQLPASGLLWALNHFVLHPRGFEISLAIGDDGLADHWVVQGDGSGPLVFAAELDEKRSADLDAFLTSLVTAPVAAADSAPRQFGCTCAEGATEHAQLCPVSLLATINALQATAKAAADRPSDSPGPGRPGMSELILSKPNANFAGDRPGFSATYNEDKPAPHVLEVHGAI